MFRITFVGHQGWLVGTDRTHVLIDPLLTDDFGHGGGVGQVFPPRRIDPAGFPPVDAVVLTHEHDDHFDIPSLNRLDRSTAVWLSERSSDSARELLATMGFASINALPADGTIDIGDLQLRTLCADHTSGRTSDEWDVLPFVIGDHGGHGTLASSVDVAPTPRMLGQLAATTPKPGVWCHANNATSTLHANALQTTTATGDDAHIVAALVRRQRTLAEAWGRPELTLVAGGGFSFAGRRAWLNHAVFPIDAAQLAEGAAAQLGDDSIRAPTPGETFALRDGRLVAHQLAQPYLSTVPRHAWPARDYHPQARAPAVEAPACGRTCPTREESAALPPALAELARYLYGRAAFRALCSMPSQLPNGMVAGWCFALRRGDGEIGRVLRYAPARCGFVDAPTDDPIAGTLSGLSCWETDLSALLAGTLGPSAMCNAGHLGYWNHQPERLAIGPHLLWEFAQPLHRPQAAARLYTTLLGNEPSAVTRVPGPR